ncbi:DUF7351 domain-containing protein [Natrialba asiatica]|uniref:ArsR family transcriptional regulator n=1 Tax=Natrialba asiatica (strain ATCC 700177 / DSM 12278 / JCM 9576 / FERM P-10747 / NBRC 102637 / 172P1) TaxID=29540 RepID=M0AVK2_NATA1|nr:hypothetical protein [Natrialba asiatica]ELZ02560.1 ArsR family transcriptional regulator [Natrialba asiatica DSM 12278]
MSAEDGEELPTASPEPSDRVSDPSDAFQALGNEIRMGILETMLEFGDGNDTDSTEATPSTPTFSALFDASEVDTTAGFAYHLDELVGPYLRKVEAGDEAWNGETESEGYELTYAGERIARAIATGTYTQRVDHPPTELDDDCPFCGRAALTAQATDNRVTVSCGHCDRRLLRLGFPPAGLDSHGAAFPAAFDRHHRHRLSLMRDGVCPDCSGAVDARLATLSSSTEDLLPAEHTDHVQAEFSCSRCGMTLRAPVALSLLSHPAVVSFYDDHDRDVRDRPIWNVGHEWAEAVLSEDPLAVRVVVELDDSVLALYVDEQVAVVDTQRASSETAPSSDGTETAETAESAKEAETAK